MNYVKIEHIDGFNLIIQGTGLFIFDMPEKVEGKTDSAETQTEQTENKTNFMEVRESQLPIVDVDDFGRNKRLCVENKNIIQLCDYRGKIAYNTSTKEAKTIDYLGDLEAGHTFEEPPEYSDWDDDNEAWLIDTISQTAARIKEKKAQLRAGLAEHCRQLAYEKDFENMHSAIVYASYTHPDPLLTDAENAQLATTIDTAKKLATYNSKFWSAVTTQHEALSDDELLALTVQQAIQQLPQYEH